MALKKLPISSIETPDYSITPLGRKKQNKFNVFDEKGGYDLGDYYDFEIIKQLGATRTQLNAIKKKGDTQNFKYMRSHYDGIHRNNNIKPIGRKKIYSNDWCK